MQLAQSTIPRIALIATLALAGSSSTGCDLVAADFEGDVKITVDVGDPDSTETTYSDILSIDPEENEEYRDNKDRIKSGEIIGIELEFVELDPANRATLVVGQADVRKKVEGGDGPWTEGIGVWQGVQVVQGNKLRLTLPVERQAELNRILFDEPGPLEIRLRGDADQGPFAAKVQVTVFLRFRAGL